MIYNRISDITISMKATDYLKMPELISSRYEVQMDDKEKQKYEEFKKDLVLEIEDGEITAANAASHSGKLSQMANGAVYSDNLTVMQIHDRKLDALEDIIDCLLYTSTSIPNVKKHYDKAILFIKNNF